MLLIKINNSEYCKLLDGVVYAFCRKMDEIHALARDGEINKIIKCIQDGISVNSKGKRIT